MERIRAVLCLYRRVKLNPLYMETTLIAAAIIIVSLLAGYGYYLIFTRDLEEFEAKKKMKTRYRTNEEFIKS